MGLVLNQFAPVPLKGVVRNSDKGQRYECQAAEALQVGDFVKIKDVASSVVAVEKITMDTDAVFGIVQYESAKANTYAKDEIVTIASDYSIITCETNAAVACGDLVMPVVVGSKVAKATQGKKVIGIAMKKATGAGELIPVLVKIMETAPAL